MGENDSAAQIAIGKNGSCVSPMPLLQGLPEDAAFISLERERPFVMRPRLVNQDNRRDLEIERRLIQQLRALNQPGQRGASRSSAPLVYLEDVELPVAVMPNGEYKYVNDQVTVMLDLLQGEKVVGKLTVEGRKDNLTSLVEKMISELALAIEKLPKPKAERQ